MAFVKLRSGHRIDEERALTIDEDFVALRRHNLAAANALANFCHQGDVVRIKFRTAIVEHDLMQKDGLIRSDVREVVKSATVSGQQFGTYDHRKPFTATKNDAAPSPSKPTGNPPSHPMVKSKFG